MSNPTISTYDVALHISGRHEGTHHVRDCVYRPDEKDDQEFAVEPELYLRRFLVPPHHVADEQGMCRRVKGLEQQNAHTNRNSSREGVSGFLPPVFAKQNYHRMGRRTPETRESRS